VSARWTCFGSVSTSINFGNSYSKFFKIIAKRCTNMRFFAIGRDAAWFRVRRQRLLMVCSISLVRKKRRDLALKTLCLFEVILLRISVDLNKFWWFLLEILQNIRTRADPGDAQTSAFLRSDTKLPGFELGISAALVGGASTCGPQEKTKPHFCNQTRDGVPVPKRKSMKRKWLLSQVSCDLLVSANDICHVQAR
jgi:hypothetical protein